jgi:hypothetical protein
MIFRGSASVLMKNKSLGMLLERKAKEQEKFDKVQ